MKFILIVSLILFTFISSFSKEYYVSPLGIDELSTDINSPGSLEYAVSNAIAGDTIWVKSGNYFSKNLIFPNSGEANNPIIFIGYNNVIGDLDSNNIPITIKDYKSGSYGGNTAKFPTLDGIDRASSGLAMQLYGRNYITLRNFHITNYNHGIGTWNSSFLNFENIICAYIGDPDNNYNGVAISISNTSFSSAKYCFVYNAAAEGISVVSSGAAPTRFNLVNKCRVICDDTVKTPEPTGPGTDYYIVLGTTGAYHAEYNEISDCYIERVGDVGHGGHGIAVVNYDYDSTKAEGKTQFNVIKNCTSVAIRSLFHLRGKETENNLFTACTSYSGYKEAGGIAITDSKNNIFDKIETNIYKDSVSNYYFNYPVMFYKTTIYSPGYEYSAVSNLFTNCLFKSLGGVGFGYYVNGTADASADSNRFVNCTFVNTDSSVSSGFILAQRENLHNSFENCIISGYKKYLATESSHKSSLKYENCLFHNNGFSQEEMSDASLIDCLFDDPLFLDATSHDFHLLENSPCIDAGKNTNLKEDFDENSRPCNDLYDIGAYEYQNCDGVSVHTFEQDNNLIIYPNPINNFVTIYSNEILDNFDIIIYDINGNEINRFSNILHLDLSNLESGFYLMKLITNNKQFIKKFIKR